MKKLLFFAALMLCSFCFISCEEEYDPDIAIGSLNINGEDYSLKTKAQTLYSHTQASYLELDSRKQADKYEGQLALLIDIDYRDTYLTEWIFLSLSSLEALKSGNDLAKISTWNERNAQYNDYVKYRSGSAIVSNIDDKNHSVMVSFKDFTVVNHYNPEERVYTINGTVKIFYNCDWDN